MDIGANLIKIAIEKLTDKMNIGYNKQENKAEVNFINPSINLTFPVYPLQPIDANQDTIEARIRKVVDAQLLVFQNNPEMLHKLHANLKEFNEKQLIASMAGTSLASLTASTAFLSTGDESNISLVLPAENLKRRGQEKGTGTKKGQVE